jgi:hypothetical protein
MSQQCRRFKQIRSLEERLADEAKSLREQAEMLPPGAVREAVLRKARQAETGSHVSEWLKSPACGRRSEPEAATSHHPNIEP